MLCPFPDGARRASPVAQRVLVIVPPLSPRRSEGRLGASLRPLVLPSLSGYELGLRSYAFGGPVRSLSLRPDDSPRSRGWRCQWASGHWGSLLPAVQATGALALAPAGLPPAARASCSWTHKRTCGFPASGFRTGFTLAPFTAGAAGARRMTPFVMCSCGGGLAQLRATACAHAKQCIRMTTWST